MCIVKHLWPHTCNTRRMTLLGLILVLAVFGFVLWLVTTFIPMPEPVKTIIIAVAVLFLLLWVLQAVGVLGGLNTPIRLR